MDEGYRNRKFSRFQSYMNNAILCLSDLDHRNDRLESKIINECIEDLKNIRDDIKDVRIHELHTWRKLDQIK